eukprot:CAMPEP_0185567032 /NCGR_PEP_ID=MMETSP0434-20130131/423_1 /TAXON_ID=626734 ORGANISM="Favella taraikaensis, Strain Fe Narragansett Bay" /NCGR_SAMPLE_ID=MMETSP0434 /ASSEMBLY_ACC=CAM_ASM_000379 /LENGTH=252 /DNA_ID=CAMNT_0028181139 /DNA_START=33 /DNA_END=791 /DNA_ORIENTATION=+
MAAALMAYTSALTQQQCTTNGGVFAATKCYTFTGNAKTSSTVVTPIAVDTCPGKCGIDGICATDAQKADCDANKPLDKQELCSNLEGSFANGICYSYSGEVEDAAGAVVADAASCDGGCAIDGICATDAQEADCEAQSIATRCPSPGLFLNAADCYLLEGTIQVSGAAKDVTTCPGGCALDGACVAVGDSADCEAVKIIAAEEEASGSGMGLILAIVGVLSAIAIAILVYCFCCKSKNDDDFGKVGADGSAE